jgi:hypothetical protein
VYSLPAPSPLGAYAALAATSTLVRELDDAIAPTWHDLRRVRAGDRAGQPAADVFARTEDRPVGPNIAMVVGPDGVGRSADYRRYPSAAYSLDKFRDTIQAELDS